MTSGAAMTRRDCVAGPRSVWQSQAMPGKRLEPGSVRGGTKGSSRAAAASRGPKGGARWGARKDPGAGPGGGGRRASDAEHDATRRELRDVKAALDEPSIVAITDAAGTITHANDRFCRISGYSREELLGRNHRILNSGHHPKSFLVDLWRTISRGGVWRGKIVNRAKDGSLYRVEATIVPFLGALGKPVQHVAIRTDVSWRKRLEREILEAGERERRRIGRDLHDSLGQRLTALELGAQGLIGTVLGLSPQAGETLRHLAQQLREAVAQTRRLSHGWSPVSLESGGLLHALLELAESTLALTRVRCQFVSSKVDAFPDSATASHLYRIAQEAVANALKHGHPRRIVISLTRRRDRALLEVADDGTGFDASADSGKDLGLGVMRYRAGLFGGELRIKSAPGKGTQVICSVPMST